jgi:hypothetical protein
MQFHGHGHFTFHHPGSLRPCAFPPRSHSRSAGTNHPADLFPLLNLEGLPRGFRPCGHSSSKSSLSFHFTLLRSVLPRPFSFISINYSLPLLCDSEIGADPVLAHIRAIHFLLSASRVPRADQNVTITQLMAIDAARPNAPYSHPNGSSSTLLTFYREKKGNPSKQRNNLDRSHRNSSSPDRAFMWL